MYLPFLSKRERELGQTFGRVAIVVVPKVGHRLLTFLTQCHNIFQNTKVTQITGFFV
jgi:hypothetical protein